MPTDATQSSTPATGGKEKTSRSPLDWRDFASPIAIALLFFLVALWRLETPPKLIFDEVYHVRTATDYLQGREPFLWVMPPLSELLMAAGIRELSGAFDTTTGTPNAQQLFAARLPSLLCGTALLLLIYSLGRSLSGNRAVAGLATILLSLDSLFFVQSRIAMTNIFGAFFILLGVLAIWLYGKRSQFRWLFLAGVALGCAMATRWTGIWAWGLCGLFLIHQLTKSNAMTAGRIIQIVSALVLVPAAVYGAAYIPFVLQGDGSWSQKLLSWNWNNHGWGRVLVLQREMWGFMASADSNPMFRSDWWSWPLMMRPIVYYFHTNPDGTVSGIWAVGNGWIWWGSIPALGWAAWRGWRGQNDGLRLAAWMGLGLWLTWAIVPRKELYMHYMFETIPFACLALAAALHRLWNDISPGLNRRRLCAASYGLLITSWALFYYPVLSALPVSEPFWKAHLWYGRILDRLF